METIKNLTAALVAGEEGQAMVEYPLIIALVSVAAITVLGSLGTGLTAKLQSAVTALTK